MSSNLPKFEWDFARVPDQELEFCQWWEYARESPTILKLDLAQRTSPLTKSQQLFSIAMCALRSREIEPNTLMAFNDMEMNKILSLMIQTDFIYSWANSTRANAWETYAGEPKNIDTWEVPAPFNVEFPASWLSRNFNKPITRKEFSGAIADQTKIMRNNVQEFLNAKRSDALIQAFNNLAGPFLTNDATGHQTVAITIDWHSYTNAQIANAFRLWVERSRPNTISEPSPDKIGVKLTDIRHSLDWLAVMRILHGCRFAHPDFPKRLKDLGEKEIYRQRIKARQKFHKLFPFLPDGEEPLSWPTKAKNSSTPT